MSDNKEFILDELDNINAGAENGASDKRPDRTTTSCSYCEDLCTAHPKCEGK